jgi:uncharacterized membrane protein
MLAWLITHSPLLYLTQSLWRDEAYSVLMAAKPISFFVSHLSYEPPLYYVFLHFWMKVFGMGEIAGRSLSLVALVSATLIVVFWAEQLFKKHWLSWWLPVFFFFNPMIVYYGMELRTYGWYIFFATLSLYAYSNKRWTLWVAATLLGFYTHTFLIIVPLAQTVHFLLTQKKTKTIQTAFFIFIVGVSPWVIKILLSLKDLKNSWYFPVDGNLVGSVLGNLFLGYEGTPGYLWSFTKFISLMILLVCFLVIRSEKTRKTAGLFITQIFLPLVVVIGVSFIKPLYVNRYMIAVTVAEIFTVALAIYSIKNARVQKTVGIVALLFILIFNVWYPEKHAKIDIRSTLEQVNILKAPTDVIIADNPLIVFETMYYAKSGSQVYLYNPNNNEFPAFVGDGLVEANRMVRDYPPYPIRAFVIHQNGTFDVMYRAPVSARPVQKAL